MKFAAPEGETPSG